MKKTIIFITFLLILSLTVACSNENSNDTPPESNDEIENPPNSENESNNDESSEEDNNDSSDNNSDKEEPLTQAQVLNEIKGQIKTDLEVKLPTTLPLNESEHLTALTTGNNNSYSVTFFKSDKPIPINNKRLVDENGVAKEIARLYVERYSSKEKAEAEIGFQDFKEFGGEEIDLGYDIIGYQDAGAGSVFIGWNEGRWSLTARSLTSQSNKGIDLAKETVKYLETHSLPIPYQFGKIHLDTEHAGNLALLQDESEVYTFDKVEQSINLLEILISFK